MKINPCKEYFIWKYNPSTDEENLAVATLDRCDNCGQICHSNLVWILNKAPEIAREQADNLKKVQAHITELCAREDGICLCESCYFEHERGD